MLKIILARFHLLLAGYVAAAGMLGAFSARAQGIATPFLDPADPSEDPIDREVLDSLRELGAEDDPELLAELLDSFLVNTDLRMERLRAAVEQGDAEMLYRAAHSLKGSSGNFGAVNLGALCQQLEEIITRDGARAACERLPQIEAEYERVKHALAVELGREEA